MRVDDDYKASRDDRGRILPGHSGNPDGLSAAKKKIRDLALSYAPEIITGMFLVWKDPSIKMKERLDAGNIVLMRALGHPPTVKEEQTEPFSMADLERTLPKLIQDPQKPYNVNDQPLPGKVVS